jgi:hypothetical protein
MADRRRNPQSENGGLADHDRATRACRKLTVPTKKQKSLRPLETVKDGSCMTADNIRFGFARLALVVVWIVAIPWLILLAG